MLKFSCAVFLLALLPHLAFAQGNSGCEPFADIPVTVTPVFDEPKTDFTQTIASIRQLAGDAHSIRESEGMISLGLTHYAPVMEIRLPVESVTFPDGTFCAHVKSGNVVIGFRDVTIYVGREIPEGSCGFNEIMAHEQKHIAVNRQVLQEYAPLIEERLKDYLRLNGMFREGNLDYAVSLLRDKSQAILNELGQKMIDDINARQHAVDSLAEYRRITASCNGQLAEVAYRAQEKR